MEEIDIQNDQYVRIISFFALASAKVLKKVKSTKNRDTSESTSMNIEGNKPIIGTKEETEILQSEIPERLRYLYVTKSTAVPEDELEVESKWITRKLEKKKKLNLDGDDSLKDQVKLVLRFMKNDFYEVVLIFNNFERNRSCISILTDQTKLLT